MRGNYSSVLLLKSGFVCYQFENPTCLRSLRLAAGSCWSSGRRRPGPCWTWSPASRGRWRAGRGAGPTRGAPRPRPGTAQPPNPGGWSSRGTSTGCGTGEVSGWAWLAWGTWCRRAGSGSRTCRGRCAQTGGSSAGTGPPRPRCPTPGLPRLLGYQ